MTMTNERVQGDSSRPRARGRQRMAMLRIVDVQTGRIVQLEWHMNESTLCDCLVRAFFPTAFVCDNSSWRSRP